VVKMARDKRRISDFGSEGLPLCVTKINAFAISTHYEEFL